MKKNNLLKTHQSGFALIQLLFVIVVLGAILVLTMNAFQQRTRNLKIQKTAFEIGQIQQAAYNYFTDNNCWPNTTACAKNAPNFKSYLPQAIVNNPWGKPYRYQVDPANATNFMVTNALPDQRAAQQIIDLLPDAILNPANTQEVTANIGATLTQRPIIQYIGGSAILHNNQCGPDGNGTVGNYCADRTLPNPFSFTCPVGWSVNAVVAPVYVAPDNYKQRCNYYLQYLLVTGSKNLSILYPFALNCEPQGTIAGRVKWACVYEVQFQSNLLASNCTGDEYFQQNTGDIAFAEIGYCIPPKTKS